jgi:hypothetical protein
MTVDVHKLPNGPEVIGFNGTTEWALDSIAQQDAVWLPSETQLRCLLGNSFRRLEREDSGWRVDIEVDGVASSVRHGEPAEAYGLALLSLIVGTGP